MTDHITIVGTAGTEPQVRTTPTGRRVATLRVASTIRRHDPTTGQWSDAGTNWYSVSAWGDLGAHVAASIRQGDPVIVQGRLRISTWGDEARLAIDIDADAVGHSLRFGTAVFTRASRSSEVSTPEPREAEPAPSGEGPGPSRTADPVPF